MNLIGTFEKLVEQSQQANAREDGDYTGDDGLLYCGKCHTRKETTVEINDASGNPVVYHPFVPCKCRKERMEREEAEAEAKRRSDRIERLRRSSNIPELYRDATFECFKQRPDNEQNFALASKYAKHFAEMMTQNRGLLFYGKIGAGKTYAAACIGNRLIESGYSVYMTSTYSMLRLRDDDAEEAFCSNLYDCSLLIIDDIGAERSTDFGRERVFTYIDGRCNAGKPMVLTTNLDFQKMLNPESPAEGRIFDRVLKRCYPIAFTGESWRREEARDNFAEMKAILQGDDND